MMIGWTTTSSREDAERLARGAVEKGLAACSQIEGPIRSLYCWEGRVEDDVEFRITFKYVREKNRDLEEWLLENHPYDTPEWLAVTAERISQKYLNWAQKTAK